MSHFSFFNPNPTVKFKGDKPCRWTKGDCVVRALCAVTDLSWMVVFSRLCELGKEMCAMPNDDIVTDAFLKEHGFERVKSAKGAKPWGNNFCDTHPIGKYVLRMSNHLCGVVDGQIKDCWDCGQCAVYSYYQEVGY